MNKYTFNEFTEQTIDFTDPRVVADYDKNQGSNIDNERELVEKLGVSSNHTVIEYGPGTGALSIALAEKCDQVFAIDTSRAMLDYIDGSAQKQGIKNISTHHTGFLSYEHQEDAVDFVFSKFTLHHLPDFWKAIALLKINKNLRVGGIFYLVDVIFSFHPENYHTSIDSWIEKVTSRGAWSREAFEVHVNEEFSTFSWILEGMIKSSGFEIIDADYWSETYGSIKCKKTKDL